MKKIGIMLLCIFAISGCGITNNKKEEQKKENNEIVNEIEKLEIAGENEINGLFDGLLVLDDNSISSNLGLTNVHYENYIAKIPMHLDSRFYIVIKPKEKYKDAIKNRMNLYITDIEQRLTNEKENILANDLEQLNAINAKIIMVQNCLKEEYKGYLIYISSSDNNKVLNIIKSGLDKIEN